MVMTRGQHGYSDVHFTSDAVAAAVIRHFSPYGRCLEPFRGDGAFWRLLPKGSCWCEIRDGRDFFAWTEQVDWIITNPPFSNMTQVFEHAFAIAANCVFVIPISKYWSSAPRIEAASRYGGLLEIAHLGRGRDIGFDIGFPFAAMHFQRGFSGPIRQVFLGVNRDGAADSVPEGAIDSLVVIDWNELLRRHSMRREFVGRVVALGLDSFMDAAGLLADPARRADRVELRRQAHRLKGLAGNLLAHEVQALAQRVVTGLDEGSETIDDDAAQLASALGRLIEALQQGVPAAEAG